MQVSVAEENPFDGVNNGVEGEEEGLVELLVPDLGDEGDEGE